MRQPLPSFEAFCSWKDLPQASDSTQPFPPMAPSAVVIFQTLTILLASARRALIYQAKIL